MVGDPADKNKTLPRLMALSQVGMEMAAPALVGLLIDRWLGISPWGVITGAMLGLVGGLIHLVQLSQPREGDGKTGKGRTP